MPYVINLSSYRVKHEGEIKSGSQISTTITSRRNISISEGDKCLFLEYSDKDAKFLAYGQVQKRDQIEGEQAVPNENEKPLLFFKLNILIQNELPTESNLHFFVYSLMRIWRYDYPRIHFRNAYSIIYDADFQTITDDDIFLQRTAFGRIVNALSIEHRMEFLREAIEDFKESPLTGKNFEEGLYSLVDYIKRKILEPGKHLTDARLFADQLIPSDHLTSLGFSDDENDEAELILPQSDKFQELFDIDKENIVTEGLSERISEYSSSERRFYRIFRNRPWPISYR